MDTTASGLVFEGTTVRQGRAAGVTVGLGARLVEHALGHVDPVDVCAGRRSRSIRVVGTPVPQALCPAFFCDLWVRSCLIAASCGGRPFCCGAGGPIGTGPHLSPASFSRRPCCAVIGSAGSPLSIESAAAVGVSRSSTSVRVCAASARAPEPVVERTFWGHQNQRPSSAAMDGVMNDRTINVSDSGPNPMVLPALSEHRRLADGGRHHREGEHQTR